MQWYHFWIKEGSRNRDFNAVFFSDYLPVLLLVKLSCYLHQWIKRIGHELAPDVRKLGIFLNQLRQYIPALSFLGKNF